MSNLLKKELQAISLLRAYRGRELEVAYSGGKDSDVLLALVQMAGVPYRAIHKNTTIDRPGTLAYCKSKGAEIWQPQESFFHLMERKGPPTRRARWCCEKLKEYPILDTCALGVRRGESRERYERYEEPTMCRVYSHGRRVEWVLPLIEWSVEDELEFISSNNIRLHPMYYDQDGQVDLTRRLGCMGCPLAGDRGKADFREFPKLFRQWARATIKWWQMDRAAPLKSASKYGGPYHILYAEMFCRNHEDYLRKIGGVGGSVREYLEEYFGVELPEV